ncbi:NADH-quinone oxidoreductase subunit L [Sulfuriferula sp.]|uniref:NADH-quinone oxidoreductase subunit L n=1 Tax=Sulfuriferula sp. TaxID=2025307 RepID=UPI0027313B37|nr:NADH-quinone oxidoreductase subunit L [Sulfuriferula sp.]MDP2027487.1 NADH-quinone oxidoreductase subunit L [Sulfuriferula sp.]
MHIFDVLGLGVILIYIIAAVVCAVAPMTPRRMWQFAVSAAIFSLFFCVLGVAFHVWGVSSSADYVRFDAAGATMTTLVTFLGLVIVRFSQRYLEGEQRQPVYAASLLATLATVVTILLSYDLGLLIAAWIIGSLTLHRLLVFYGDRHDAIFAAHKMFLASRLAEVCLIASAALLYFQFGTLEINEISQHIAAMSVPTFTLQASAVLLALGVAFKSAQLPVHGWLIQVMEAPTPVSALLHAGVVNLGGFVLIRMRGLLDVSTTAQALLVILGGTTALVSGLVMLTRVSIKVRLAWSTCAQMGFLLLECGLGLYELAMAHLVGHSLYKAHAFLHSGTTVRDVLEHRLLNAHSAHVTGSRRWMPSVLAVLFLTAVVAAMSYLVTYVDDTPALPLPWIVIVALAFAPVLWAGNVPGARGWMHGVALAFVMIALYMVWHVVLHGFGLTDRPTYSVGLSLLALAFMLALYIVQVFLALGVASRWMRVLRRHAYDGFDLDEWATRLTFHIWPVALPATARMTPAAAIRIEPMGRKS